MEVMLSVTILSLGIVASFAMIASSMTAFANSKNKIIASNLAQDGIERVRNLRDTNWLEGRTKDNTHGNQSWDYGISGQGNEQYIKFPCEGGSVVYIASGSISGVTENDKIDSCGVNCQVYLYDSGTSKCYSDIGTTANSKFFRLIHIENIDNRSNRIIATIKWVDKNGSHYFTVKEILYNWKEVTD